MVWEEGAGVTKLQDRYLPPGARIMVEPPEFPPIFSTLRLFVVPDEEDVGLGSVLETTLLFQQNHDTGSLDRSAKEIRVEPERDAPGLLAAGIPEIWPPGNYELRLDLRASGQEESFPLLRWCLLSGREVLAETYLYPQGLKETANGERAALSFTLPTFRSISIVLEYLGGGRLSVGSMQLAYEPPASEWWPVPILPLGNMGEADEML